MSFWKKVCYELEFKGISRKELSAKIGVPAARVNRAIERDSQPFALDALKISKTLNLSLEYLLDLPATKAGGKPAGKDESKQIELYKKYHSLIEILEKLPQGKQKEAVELVKKITDFAK